MPYPHSAPPSRSSGRLGKHIAVIYDNDGWPITESIKDLAAVKQEDQDFTIPPLIASPSSHTSTPRPEPCPPSGSQPRLKQSKTPVVRSEAPLLKTSSLPLHLLNRNTHRRRRGPGHIPRPRNAFICFRSAYILSQRAKSASSITSGSRPSGPENQQNELSKHAGLVWNEMSDEERQPYVTMALEEKMLHHLMYPNYVYAPAGGRAGAFGRAPQRKITGPKRKSVATLQNRSRCSDASDVSMSSPEMDALLPTSARSPRAPRAAANRAKRAIQLFSMDSPSASASPLPKVEEVTPLPLGVPELDDFVPTDEIPALELTPKEEEVEVKLEDCQPKPCDVDLAPREYPYDHPDATFGFKRPFKSYLTPSSVMLACFQPDAQPSSPTMTLLDNLSPVVPLGLNFTSPSIPPSVSNPTTAFDLLSPFAFPFFDPVDGLISGELCTFAPEQTSGAEGSHPDCNMFDALFNYELYEKAEEPEAMELLA